MPMLLSRLLAVTSLLAATAATAAQTWPAAGWGGQSAIDQLGSRLEAVAALNRRSPQALRDLLRQDPTMRLDAQGRLFAVDVLDAALPASGVAPRITGIAPAALDQTFKLHSRKGAQRTIYLDFNGAVLTNTAWNSNGNTITAGPFDADGNVSTDFSAAELERIQLIWQRVAEDFAPLDIDVTTEEPRAGRLTRKDLADSDFGTTVLITSNVGVYDCSCGGVAYVGVFDSIGDRYKPALVFWNMLGSGNEKYVAEAISHEAGHNLGLSHDGYAGGGYYPGHGEGPTGWAPIMGVGYYRELVQWSQGEYDTANNTEDDFAVMASNGGPLRADDHGNTPELASALSAAADGTQVLLTGQGVIESRQDKDVFSFEAGPGAISLSVQPDSRSPNLDVGLRLMDAQGKTLAKSKPVDTLAAALEFVAPAAGTYYLQVGGVGIGDVRGTGYRDYGSLGHYRISGTVSAP